MGDFFDRLSKSISNTTKNVKDSVADSRKKSDLRHKISSAETRMTELKTQIGTKVYEAYTTDTDIEDLSEVCKQIDALLEDIKTYRKQILAVDGIKLCPNCGKEISFNASFCSHCGAKQETNAFGSDADDDTDIDDIKEDADKEEDLADDGYFSVGGK